MDAESTAKITALLDEFGDAVSRHLAALGVALHASPFFRPFSLVMLRDSAQVLVGISPATGMSNLQWLDQPDQFYAPAAMVDYVKNQLGWELSAVVSLPLPEDLDRTAKIDQAAESHSRETEASQALSRLGDVAHVNHLEPYLRTFLTDNPDFERNVFVMMRFLETPQMREIHETIVTTLREHGMNAVRADDRDYTGDLWSNIEVYLTGCKYGIAVFEDMEQRDYNPNVSLELGYMMARGKRTLLLKERRLPRVPTDVVHRLYKEFDAFDIEASVRREVGRWIRVDLGIST